MTPVIQLERVTKTYGCKTTLDDVSLQVPEGVVFALLGENGAGKTTLIRILTGFLAPESGTASVMGQDCRMDSMQIRRQIGHVSDAPAIYDWMRPEELGWFTSAFYEDNFPRRYLELIAEFDIPTGTAIKHLSKGQRAKVALALATAHDPKLLILDEPTSGLDPMVRRHFLESMVDRADGGRTVLLSSHQINPTPYPQRWRKFSSPSSTPEPHVPASQGWSRESSIHWPFAGLERRPDDDAADVGDSVGDFGVECGLVGCGSVTGSPGPWNGSDLHWDLVRFALVVSLGCRANACWQRTRKWNAGLASDVAG